MKTITLKNTTLQLRNDGILNIHIETNAELQLDDAKAIVEMIGKLGGGKKFPVLIDAGEFAHIDKEVRAFSASPESNIYTMADALAYHSFAQKLQADFYVKNNHPTVPTRVFANKAEAIEWLKKFLKTRA